jgi:hypothetical protein
MQQQRREGTARAHATIGGMAERFKAPVLKTGMGASPSGVRIPLPPLPHFPRAATTVPSWRQPKNSSWARLRA